MRPLYNVGCVAYYELNIDYIIETYCINKEKPELKCNGKCHLATQLAANTQDAEKENSYLNSLFETFVPVFFQKYNSTLKFIYSNTIIHNNWNYSKRIASIYQEKLDRPPQV